MQHLLAVGQPAIVTRAWLRLLAVAFAVVLVTGSLLAATPAHAANDESSPAMPPAAEPAVGVQPDIIVVMIDDFGYIPDQRVLKRLPNIKRLWLDDGLRFTRLYTETPLCCPARATFLTGQPTLGHTVIDNEGDAMDPSSTIAVSLDEAGYQTLMMGKYLNRYDGTRTPPGWDRVFMRESSVVPSFSIDGELTRYDGEHFDDVLRRTAVEWLGEAPLEEPVFALVAPRAPHRHPQMCEKGQFNCQYLPLVMERDRRAAECRGIAKFKPPTYAVPESTRFVPWSMPDFPNGWPLRPTCESLLVVDRMIGELLEVQAQRDRPAYFVLLSDNGMSWGQKGFPLKHAPTATRLPFYVNGPDVEPGRTDALLSNVDIAATLAELAGASSPAPDGVSFVPLLRGLGQAGRDELLEIMPADPRGLYAGWAGLRTPKWRYIRWDSGKVELYDLSKDRWDQNNVAKRHRKRVRAMDARLDEMILASRGPNEAQP